MKLAIQKSSQNVSMTGGFQKKPFQYETPCITYIRLEWFNSENKNLKAKRLNATLSKS